MKKSVLLIGIAVLVRLALFSTGLPRWFSERNEFSTPVSSWKRLTEGLTLLKHGISPYEGDLYHEMPLTLSFWKLLIECLGAPNMKFFFILLDVLTGLVLYKSCGLFSEGVLKEQEKNKKKYAESALRLMMLSEKDLEGSKLLSLSCYLFNPLTIASCLSMNTAILNNLTTILAFHAALKCNRLTLSLFLSLSTYLSFYPFVLILPLSIIIAHHDKQNNTDRSFDNSIFYTSLLQTFICFCCFTTLLIFASKQPHLHFLSSTFGFIFFATDHSPNIGIFWYFFVENFEHFKFFFLCVFQIHAVLYAFPISIRLVHQPYFASFVTLVFISIFKSYPSYTDLVLWLALSCHFSYLFRQMRNVFVSVVVFVVCAVLAVVFEYLWLKVSSANANFYFAATLGITVSQLILLFDLLFAHQKRLFQLISGCKRLGPDGLPVKYLLE